MKKLTKVFWVFIVFVFVFSCTHVQKKELNKSNDITTKNSMISFSMDWENFSTGELDLSFLLEKPAGKDGYLRIRNGHFYTPLGKQFRIWGINLTAGACFPEKNEAPKLARYFAALGINSVRFHFLDSNRGSESSLFRFDTASTRVLNPVQLDKLDFFVSELKKQGIYSNFNLNVGRTYREGDNVPFYDFLGYAKAITLFDDHLIELQKEYAKNLLTHRNSYTGNEYRNETALAFVEIVNENSLVEAWFRDRLLGNFKSEKTGTWIDIPAFYADELTAKYNIWLKENLTENQIQSICGEVGIEKGDIIPRLKSNEFREASKLRFYSEARFIIETENDFYTGMHRYLNDSIKINQLVAANSDHSHSKSSYALLSSISKLDFVDGHVYWQHPNYIVDSLGNRTSFNIENTAMVKDPFWSTVVQLSRSAVIEKPFTISETNHPYPNEYSCEGIPILTAYSLLQDWDGIYFYTFEHNDPLDWKNKVPGHFDLSHDPVKVSNLVISGLMFHRGDIKSANTTIYRNYNNVEIIEGIRQDLGPKPFFTKGFSLSIPLVYKTRIRSFTNSENQFPKMEEQNPLLSETGELSWFHNDEQGLVKIETAKTQALVGYSQYMNNVNTKNLSAKLENEFASVVLSSLDGLDIDHSKKMLLVVSSTSILSGAVWNEERNSLLEWGNQPFLIQPVTGKVTVSEVKINGKVKISPLDGKGNILGKSLFRKVKKNEYSFDLDNQRTLWYLIEYE